MRTVWNLMIKGERKPYGTRNRTIWRSLSSLMESIEEEHYPLPCSPPNQVFKTLMEDRSLNKRIRLPIVGSSGIVSEVVNGGRSISKVQAKKLSTFFHVSAEGFI